MLEPSDGHQMTDEYTLGRVSVYSNAKQIHMFTQP